MDARCGRGGHADRHRACAGKLWRWRRRAYGRRNGTALSQEAAAGKKLFVRQLCTGCHTLAAVDGAEGVAGPNLDQSLEGDDAAYIRESIVDPGAVLDPRFPKTIMPATGPEAAIPSRRITDEEVDQIVAFLLTTLEN